MLKLFWFTLDDVLITGPTEEAHLKSLELALDRLQSAGLRLKKSKCVFLASSVEYLGYRIDQYGLHPTKEKVKAIQDAPAPRNVAELRSYLGLVNYYMKFVSNLSTTLSPLYTLLRSSSKWRWSTIEEKAFQTTKDLLTSAPVLIHYDPTKPLLLACDASPYGVGAVLSHQFPDGTEKPIAFASRTLTAAEQNYAQIEKESLACIFGVKRFHQYLFGHHFVLTTDHKPLLGLLDGSQNISPQATARIQRWALTLAAYEYSLKHKTSEKHANADALSRLPVKCSYSEVPIPAEMVLLMEQIDNMPVTADMIKAWTRRDPVLARVLQFVVSGWPVAMEVEEQMKPYWSKRLELTCSTGWLHHLGKSSYYSTSWS